MNPQARIPQERLNQIAQRKLAQLGIDCKLPKDGSPLQGELPFRDPPVVHPLTQKRIERAQFVLVGHDKLRLVDPPVFEDMEDIEFFEAKNVGDILAKVSELLARRAAEMQAAAAMLRLLNVDPRIDQDQLKVSALLDIGAAQVEVTGHGAQAMAVTRLVTAGGGPQILDPEQGKLDLGQFTHRSDLEIKVGELAQGLLGQAEPSSLVRAPSHALAAAPSKAGPPSLGELVEKFGPDMRIVGTYQIGREVVVGDVKRKFVVAPVAGRTFAGKVISPSGKEQIERFDLDRFPGVEAFVAAMSGLEMPRAAVEPAAVANRRVDSALVGAVPGEVWVMDVVVENDDGQEIRYVPTDVDGKPFGAQRVLHKDDFARTFASTPGGGWRLRIRIDAIDGDMVTYQQLDAAGAEVGPSKKMRTSVMTQTFLPEAAAYT